MGDIRMPPIKFQWPYSEMIERQLMNSSNNRSTGTIVKSLASRFVDLWISKLKFPSMKAKLAVSVALLGLASPVLALESQSITFGPISPMDVADAPFTITATASSSLDVAFGTSTSTVCAVSANTVTLLASGTCTIAADQSGNSTYSAAPQVVQSFQVKDLTPNGVSFPSITSAPLGIFVFSNAVTVSGITDEVDINIENGEYSVGCTANFFSTPGKILSGKLLCVRHMTSESASTKTITKVTVGRLITYFESETEPPDTTPDQFRINDITNVEPNSSVVSLPVPIQGINVPTPISIVGGEYSVGCTSTFVSTQTTVRNRNVVCIRVTTAGTFSSIKTATLTVGDVSDNFSTLNRAAIDGISFSESLSRIPGIENVGKIFRDSIDSSKIYATSNSGLAISEDFGLSWKTSKYSEYLTNNTLNLYGLTQDTTTPSTWYGLTINQLYKSQDNGSTWKSMRLDSVGSLVCVGVNPVDPNFIVIGVAVVSGGSPGNTSLYISQTGGGSWSLTHTTIPYMGCDFMFDGVSTDSFFLITNGTYYSINKIQVSSGAAESIYLPEINQLWTSNSARLKTQDGKSAYQLWRFKQCIEDFNSTAKCSAQISIDSSSDGGRTYIRRGEGSLGISLTQSITALVSQFRISDISVNSWLGSKMGVISQLQERVDSSFITTNAIFESVSEGSSWQRRMLPSGVSMPTSILALTNSGNSALLLATERGIYRKQFGEEDWQNSSVGLSAPTVSVIASSRSSSTTVMLGTKEAGAYLTTNGGTTWNSSNKGLPPFSNILGGCFDSASDLLGYVVVGTKLYRTIDRASNWTATPTPPPLTNVRGVYCPPGKPNVVYAAGSGGLFTLARSDNAGLSWTNIDGLDGASVNSLALSPQSDTIYVGASTGLFKSISRDSLTKISSAIFARIAVSPFNPQHIYGVTPVLANVGFDYMKVQMSLDDGVSWRDINPPPEVRYGGGSLQYWKAVTGIAVHPTSNDVIFVSSSMGGIFASFDNGIVWLQLGKSTSTSSVFSLDLLFAGAQRAAFGASRSISRDSTDTLLVIAGGADGYVTRLALSTPLAPSNPPRLLNIATRGRVETVDNVMIAGFIIQGSSPKKVLIRARGPSLAAAPFNVPGTLSDPFLTLYSGATPIDTNDDFAQHANAAQIPADWIPANAKEAAIATTLSPGAYTAIVNGVGATSGVAIVEVFEIDQPGTPLINIATRGPVYTGDNVMIAGLIIQGDAPKTVLITARGPSMAGPPHNVPGTLANPTLTLYSGQTVIGTNDNWIDAANATQIQTAIGAPSNTLESAILVTLQPGAYTAIVSGAGGGTGLAIVEVFAQ